VHVGEQQIFEISRDVWANRLGLSIVPAPADAAPDSGDRTLASCVKISGSWSGTIVVECPESIARHAAAMLFHESGSDEDARDALGELAEMIARKMRPLLPDESKLSKPAMLEGDDALSGLKNLSELRLSCEGHPVRIALFESESEPTPTAAPA
jgi:CheY-specific phosphatase CheX